MKLFAQKCSFIVLFFLFFAWSSVYAASVTNVSSGTISGHDVTIEGMTFGTKDSAEPLKWDDFEQGVNGSVLKNWSLYSNAGNLPVYSTQRKNGLYAAKCDFTTDSQYNSSFQLSGVGWSEVFISFYYMADYGSASAYNGQPSRNFKVLRVEGNNGSKTGDQHEGVPLFAYEHRQPTNGDAEVAIRAEYSPAVIADTFYSGNLPWAHQEWHKVDIYASVRAGKRTFKMWEDGINRSPSDAVLNDCWIPNMGDGDSQFNEIKLGFYFARDNGASAYTYFDDVYIDSTQARVELGNNPVFSNCTHREIQIPTAWSDTEITVTFNQGSFQDGDTAYLFVVDENGNASPGYEVTIGEAADTSAPAVSGQSPAADEINVAKNTYISFHVTDGGAGVDRDSIKLYIDDVESAISITGEAADYTVTTQYEQSFDNGQIVDIKIDAQDLNTTPIVMPTVHYTFTVTSRAEDVDADGDVDADDVNIVVNETIGNPTGKSAEADVNGDSKVDSLDVQTVVNEM